MNNNHNMDIWIKLKTEKDSSKKEEIKKEIIILYVKLVKIIAGKLYTHYGSNVEFDDLVGYGVLGLIDAIDKYDYTKNIKFETYASIRIRGAIIDEIRNLDWIPRSIRQKAKKVSEAYKNLEMTLGREPDKKDLAVYFEKSEDEVMKMLEEINIYNVISLEEELRENLKIQVPDETLDSNPEDSLIKKDTIEILKKSLETLKEREQMVINLYYYENLTYKEIGSILSISESRVSQIHSKAIIKIKNTMNI